MRNCMGADLPLYEDEIRSVEGPDGLRGGPPAWPLHVSSPGSVRTMCGNAEEGPYLMRTFPQKYAYGAEIGP
jgi:hypothetical protein